LSQETVEAYQRLLLPPGDERWAGNGAVHTPLHRLVGVFDGLRLISIDPKSWSTRFQANKNSFLLPQDPRPAWSRHDWNEYRSVTRHHARPIYNWGNYQGGLRYSPLTSFFCHEWLRNLPDMQCQNPYRSWYLQQHNQLG